MESCEIWWSPIKSNTLRWSNCKCRYPPQVCLIGIQYCKRFASAADPPSPRARSQKPWFFRNHRIGLDMWAVSLHFQIFIEILWGLSGSSGRSLEIAWVSLVVPCLSIWVPSGSLGGLWEVPGVPSAPMTLEGLSEILGVSWGYLGVIFVDWGGPWFPPRGDNIDIL